MSTLLYTAAQVRELDRRAIEDHGIGGLILMRRAAHRCVEEIVARFDQVHSNESVANAESSAQINAGENTASALPPELKVDVTVCCGSGNNAADGYIIAGMLHEKGWFVQVMEVGDPAKLGADGAAAYQYCQQAGVPVTANVGADGIVVDALLGTGVSGEVRPAYAEVIQSINASGLPVLSVDVPSGLSSDTGKALGLAVNAALTVTFIGRKRGLYTADGPDHAGQIVFTDLDVPGDVYLDLPGEVVDVIQLQPLPPRKKNTHKNTFGHVLVVGGDHGMGGAVIMTAEAALRAGAGLVSVATREAHVLPLMTRCPEVMTRGVREVVDLLPLLAQASVVVVGPGLGQGDWGRAMLSAVLATDLPLVVDADGLNLLADDVRRANWVLTPHPGEARRLGFGDLNRFDAVTGLQQRHGGAVVLKGVGSLVAADQSLSLCDRGNPGMAAAGMGDLLSGVIGAFLAQYESPTSAANQGVLVHALAGDLAAKDGMAGLMATDLLPHIRALAEPLKGAL